MRSQRRSQWMSSAAWAQKPAGSRMDRSYRSPYSLVIPTSSPRKSSRGGVPNARCGGTAHSVLSGKLAPGREGPMREAVVVASSRTPLAKSHRGSFNMTRPDDLAADCIRHALAKVPDLDAAEIEEVILATLVMSSD